jgi:hypothetical protein
MGRRTYTEEEVFNLELKANSAGFNSGSNSERRRINALLDKELNECECGTPLAHLRELINQS